MKTYIKNDLKRVYLVLEGKEEDQDDYQAVMLRENEIPGILRTDVRYIDNRIHYYYDISGKTSIKAIYEKVNLSYDDMKGLVWELISAIQNIQKYMLDGNCILLEPEMIFRDQEKYYFCYYPSCGQESRKEFHRLTEFFVRKVNDKDEKGVHFAYTLHKATMEANYSIEEIMRRLSPETVETSEEKSPEIPLIEASECAENEKTEKKVIRIPMTFFEKIRKTLEKSRFLIFEDEEEDL